jgi:Leucine-rich repeat (LRR) protein
MSVQILNIKYDINLQKLDLSSRQLENLPDSIGNFINLQYLDLFNNNLKTLPDSIGNLINLQELDLRYNQLDSLPDSIGNLINLKELYLHNNQLESLPDSIGNLINLQKLYLHNNRLESLPTSILKIKEVLLINHTSYQINNLNMETEILIFSYLNNKLLNLPISLREIWIKKGNPHIEHKLPFNCELKYY